MPIFKAMFDDPYRPPPRKRHQGHPIRAFLELHPTLVPTIFAGLVIAALALLVLHRFAFLH